MHFELSPLIVWIALWIVNTYTEFQVNIFSITEILQNVEVFVQQWQQGYRNTSGFSENSHAKNQLSFLPANPFNLNNSKILSYGRADITKVKNVIL